MKICLVSMEWPPYSGGIATYMYALAQGLSKIEGNQVTVLTAERNPVNIPGIDIRCVAINLPKSDFFSKLTKWKMEPFDFWAKAAFNYFTKNFSSKDFDIIESAEYGAWARYFTNQKIPLVTRCHNTTKIVWSINCQNRGSYFMPTWVAFQDYKERTQTLFSSGITAPSYSLANHLALQWNLDRSSIKVIPNGIDTNQFSPAKSQLASPVREILFIGRFQLGKGIYDFLEAIIPLLEKYPDTIVKFVGRDMPAPQQYASFGKTASEVIKKKIRPELAERVIIVPPVPQQETIEYYRNAYCVVIPTRGYESFSYTCLEAMSCGCSIVATNCGGPSELLVNGESGNLVEPGNIIAIREAINLILADNKLAKRFSLNSRKVAIEKFDVNTMAEKTNEYYQQVLSLYEKKH